MHKEGHLGLTLLLFSIIGYIFNFWNEIALTIALIFSVVPDYDIRMQRAKGTFRILAVLFTLITFALFLKLKNPFLFSIPILFYVIHLMGEHRGFSHTLTFAFLCGALMGFFTLKVFGDFSVGFVGAFLGVLSHILGDLLTHKPFSPLYPFCRRRFALKLVKSSNPIANYLLLISGFVSLTVLYRGIVLKAVANFPR